MKKEIPILFSTLMVQAILAGRKTMTRRILKPRTPEDFALMVNMNAGLNFNKSIDELIRCSCPYGKSGDILWVRESFCKWSIGGGAGIYYKADHPDDKIEKWKPSIHMPKDCSRIWLEVTDIKVERLQDITEQDAVAEGVESWIDERLKSRPVRYRVYEPNSDPEALYSSAAYDSFQTLWESINGIESWNDNPWVWAISFKVLSTTGKPNAHSHSATVRKFERLIGRKTSL